MKLIRLVRQFNLLVEDRRCRVAEKDAHSVGACAILDLG